MIRDELFKVNPTARKHSQQRLTATEIENKKNKNKLTKRILAKKNETFSIKEFEDHQCTLTKFGDVEISQGYFYCPICDIDEEHAICGDCFKNCHSRCNIRPRLREDITKNAMKNQREFVCNCGKINKHKISEPPTRTRATCMLRKMDVYLNSSSQFICHDCNGGIQICSVCYSECHKDCNTSKIEKKVSEEDDKVKECRCAHENHVQFPKDEFTFVTICSEKFLKLEVVDYSLQYKNLLFSSKENFLLKLKEFVSHFFTEFISICDTEESLKDEQEYYDFLNIMNYISNMFTGKLYTYYFSEEIINLFSFKNIEDLINKKINEKYQKSLKLKSNLCNILFNVHVRRDFQHIKGLTTTDFLYTSFLERQKSRAVLAKHNFYSDSVYEYIEGDKLESLCFNLLNNVYVELLNEPNYKIDLHVGLKFLSFILKRMIIFKRDKLLEIIGIIDKIHRRFFIDITRTQTDKVGGLEIDLEIISYFIKIVYLLSITWNDLEANEHLNNHSYKPNYIHKNDEAGDHCKLFEIILKNSQIVSKYKDKLENKILRIYYESLKLFSITDNEFLSRTRFLTEHEFEYLTTNKKRIESLASTQIYNTVLIDGSGNDIVHNFKMDIEQILKTYFLLFDIEKKFNHNSSHITLNEDNPDKNFINSLEIFSRDAKSAITSYHPEANDVEDYDGANKFKYIRFKAKLKQYIGSAPDLDFVNDENFDLCMSHLVDELIFNQLDSSLSKYIGYVKGLSDNDVSLGLKVTALFMFNIHGIKHIFYGKTINRILLALDNHTEQVLEFFYLLSKGIHIFNVDISCSKLMDVMEDKFIKCFESITNPDKSTHLTYLIKILHSLASNWDSHSWDNIKERVINHCHNIGLFDTHRFNYIFKDDKIFISNNFVIIQQSIPWLY